MKGRVGGRRWHILVPHVRVLSSVNQKVAARGFGSSHPDPAAQTQPRAASETGAPSPITKWSSRRTSTSASDCLSRAVTARSAALGSALPLGWLWPDRKSTRLNSGRAAGRGRVGRYVEN